MKELASYITINPEIRFEKPCIKNTRIALADILQWLASEMSHAEILKDYPLLKEEHIRAALMFAANRESMIKLLPPDEIIIRRKCFLAIISKTKLHFDDCIHFDRIGLPVPASDKFGIML
ncbi:MAG: DUF433 domain-containing protein [Ginsengibacter sp.]